MKRKLIVTGLILALVALPLAAACAKSPAPTVTVTAPAPTPTPKPTVSTEKHTFTFSYYEYPTSDRIHMPGNVLQRELYRRSDGRIQLNIVNKMFGTMDLLAAVTEGRADMGSAWLAFLSGTYPLFNWAELPGVTSPDAFEATKQEWMVATDPRLVAIYDKAFRELGVTYLFQTLSGPSNVIYANKPGNTVAGLKDMKVRTPGHIGGLSLQALGAKPVQVPYEEVSQAMLTGIVDAVASNWEGWVYYGFTGKTAKYVIPMPFGPGWADFTVMNAKKFDSLPPDLQKVIKDVSRDVTYFVLGNAQASVFFWVDKVQDLGMEILQWSPEEIAKAKPLLAPVEQEWLKIAGPYGPDVLKIAKDVAAKYEAMNLYPK
ncbi:MAG: TRAP transporter substrate-binding protein DctP [Chloroflexi bacterium]|nr:TRAP transporter substrate-binding protein DctP [Chloroflexota bacterium]